MASISDIMQRELDLLVTNLRLSMTKSNRNATGKTSQEINSEVITSVNKVTGIVVAPEHVLQLELGRKPTEGEPTGSSEWYDSTEFENWLAARNIPLEAKYPIFKKIHEKGFKGTKGLISKPVENTVDRITERIADSLIDNAFNFK